MCILLKYRLGGMEEPKRRDGAAVTLKTIVSITVSTGR